jgi:hypothetical protein
MKHRPLGWLVLALALLPALIPLVLILTYGVNMPFWDEWDPGLAGLYIKAHQHQLSFADLAAQHNEHRILLPRIAYLLLNSMTHWNAVGEMVFQWLIVFATSIGILVLIRKTQLPSEMDRPRWPVGLSGRSLRIRNLPPTRCF